MSRWSRSMSPAALAISVLALVVATSAGTAYAAVKIGTRQLKNGAVTSAKIKDGTVASVDLRNAGVTGLDVADGSLGATDLSAAARNALRGARAYATVDPVPSGGDTPMFVAERTRGFTAITEHLVNKGQYCLTVDPALGLDTTKVTVVVGLDAHTTYVSDGRALWDSTTDCGAGKISVKTYNGATLDDNVGFAVAIP